MNIDSLVWKPGVWIAPDGKRVLYDEADITHLIDTIFHSREDIYGGIQMIFTIRRWPRKVVVLMDTIEYDYDFGDNMCPGYSMEMRYEIFRTTRQEFAQQLDAIFEACRKAFKELEYEVYENGIR